MDIKTKAILTGIAALHPAALEIIADLRAEVTQHVSANGESDRSTNTLLLLDKVEESINVIDQVLKVL